MRIAGMVVMSHSPSWNLQPVDGPAKPYVDAVFRARARVAQLKPDAIVAFGPDHVRNFFFDLMPAFCIGVEKATAFGDYDSPKGPLPVPADLAAHIAEYVVTDGFDPALSHNMGVDHGISQPIGAMTPGLDVPVVPIMVSSGGAPLPTLARCHAFGQSVGRAIRAFPGDGRVLVIGSGGMSHSPPSISPADPSLDPEMRDYLINGRPHVGAFNAARETSSRQRRAAGGTGPINEEWDRWVLECIRAGDLAPLLAMDNAALLAAGGTGGQELRAWLAALGGWSGAIQTTDYAPVPTWITGMGCVTAFETEAA